MERSGRYKKKEGITMIIQSTMVYYEEKLQLGRSESSKIRSKASIPMAYSRQIRIMEIF